MSAVTEERIRSCLIREGVCGNAPAAELASVIAAEINEGDAGKVTEDQLARAIAELNASIAQLAREFAERDAARAELFAQHISEMHELERQRDEREREQNCIREVEERGTRRDTELQGATLSCKPQNDASNEPPMPRSALRQLCWASRSVCSYWSRNQRMSKS